MDDKDRTIRMQQNKITKLEEENERKQELVAVTTTATSNYVNQTETVNTATQTERVCHKI